MAMLAMRKHLKKLSVFLWIVIAAFIGTALGSAITIAVSINGIDLSAALGDTGFSMSPIIYPTLSLRSTVFVFVYSVVIASLASFVPTRRAAKIEPVEALRA